LGVEEVAASLPSGVETRQSHAKGGPQEEKIDGSAQE